MTANIAPCLCRIARSNPHSVDLRIRHGSKKYLSGGGDGMRVGVARRVARDWVTENVRNEDWFRGAYFSGSTVEMPDEAELPTGSDVDIMVVTGATDPPPKLGKFLFRDVLLEVTYLSWHELTSKEAVFTNYHLANAFRLNTIIFDPTGYLHELQSEVSSCFTHYEWVRRRCENARQKAMRGIQSLDATAPWHDQVNGWLFPTGITTHVLLVAALRNPTVRLRYLAVREVLKKYDHSYLYPELLQLLGCADMTSQRALEHLGELAHTFDAAAQVARTEFPFSSDITPIARPIAIDAAQELIKEGNHREAVFWMMATFARCHKILAADARELHVNRLPFFTAMVRDLGITSFDDLVERGEQVLCFLPRLWGVAEAIMEANPDIVVY